MIPRRFYTAIQTAALLGLAAVCLCRPQAAALGFSQGLLLCLQAVFPALFPFLVLNACLPRGRPAAQKAWALASAWLGGYAVCAQNVADLRRSGRLGARQAQDLLILGCCSSPGFVIGCLGGQLLGSVRLGALLYGLQLAANLFSAALLRLLPAASDTAPAAEPTGPAVPDARPGLSGAVRCAVDSCLYIGGCIVFFRVLGCALAPLAAPALRPFVSAALEISSGCADFAAAGGAAALYGCCLCLSVLGVSVFAQLHGIMQGRVPLARFALSRLLHAVILQALVRLCLPFVPGSAAVFSSLAPRIVTTRRLAPDTALLCLLFFCCLLYKMHGKNYNKNNIRAKEG